MVVRNTKAARRALDEATRDAAAIAELDTLPVQDTHAAGIDVGDRCHWACVASTPDGSETVREFPAHAAACSGASDAARARLSHADSDRPRRASSSPKADQASHRAGSCSTCRRSDCSCFATSTSPSRSPDHQTPSSI